MRSDKRSTFIETARRTQIVDAAVDTIADLGFGRASLARIAERAGTSKGVILYHFDSKDELVREVVAATYTGAADDIAVAIEAAADHRAKLAAYISGNLAFLAEHRREVRVLAEIFVSFRDAEGRMAYDESQVGSVVAPLEALLRAGQDRHELRDFDCRVVARSIRAAIDAVTPQLELAPDLDVEAYADELVTLFDVATRA